MIFTGAYWVDASNIGQEDPEVFVWSDHEQVASELWGEPNNDYHSGKACVFLATYFGKLYDDPCANERPFLCKVQLKDLGKNGSSIKSDL